MVEEQDELFWRVHQHPSGIADVLLISHAAGAASY